MRVLFVYPDVSGTFSQSFHYGLGYLSAVLKRAGHETSLLHVTKRPSRREFRKLLAEFQPGLIAFSATTHQFPFAQRYAAWAKQLTTAPTICGGVHATLCADGVLADRNFDIVCTGEADLLLLELVEHLEAGEDITQLEGLIVREGETIHRNGVPTLVQDLDSLPFPDRTFDALIAKTQHADMLAGRGCPYDCSYCCNRALMDAYKGKGKFVRHRSVENILEEVELLIREFGVKSIDFHDDTFTLDRHWLAEFCESYASRFDLPFVCNGRPNTLTREVLESLAHGGCDMIRIGVESGNEDVRRKVLGRKLSNEHLIETFRTAHELGLKTSAFNMIGVPFETASDVEETLALNKELNPTRSVITVFYPYPMTELHDVCEERGYITDKEKDSHSGKGTTLDLPELSEKQINGYYDQFKNEYYESELALRRPGLLKPYRAFKSVVGDNAARATFTSVQRTERTLRGIGPRLRAKWSGRGGRASEPETVEQEA